MIANGGDGAGPCQSSPGYTVFELAEAGIATYSASCSVGAFVNREEREGRGDRSCFAEDEKVRGLILAWSR